MAPKHLQLQIFIQANIVVGQRTKNLPVSGRFIKVFYKTTTCPRRDRLIQVWLYCFIESKDTFTERGTETKVATFAWNNSF